MTELLEQIIKKVVQNSRPVLELTRLPSLRRVVAVPVLEQTWLGARQTLFSHNAIFNQDTLSEGTLGIKLWKWNKFGWEKPFCIISKDREGGRMPSQIAFS